MAAAVHSDAIWREAVVSAPVEGAFAQFTEGISLWWPRPYTWARSALDCLIIQPREGGRCIERSIDGCECDWGWVIVWEPPHRFVIYWKIGAERVPEPDPERCSEVEVRFVAETPTTTRVELEHRAFSRHGEGSDGMRDGMGSPYGWAYLLEQFASSLA